MIVAGEGAAVPIPLKGVFKGVADAVDAIVATVDAHRANLGVCKQIETGVAQCTKLLEYRTPAGNSRPTKKSAMPMPRSSSAALRAGAGATASAPTWGPANKDLR